MLSIVNTRGFQFIFNFFFIVNPTQIFLADFCIRPDLFYSGLLFFDFTHSSDILKMLHLFSMSSTDRDYNKKLYTTSSDLFFE